MWVSVIFKGTSLDLFVATKPDYSKKWIQWNGPHDPLASVQNAKMAITRWFQCKKQLLRYIQPAIFVYVYNNGTFHGRFVMKESVRTNDYINVFHKMSEFEKSATKLFVYSTRSFHHENPEPYRQKISGAGILAAL